MLIEKKRYLLITKERRESCALMCLSDLTGKIQGFEVIVPGKATMEHTIIPSIEAKSRKDGDTHSIALTRDGKTKVQNDGKHSTDEKLIPVEKPNVFEIKEPALRQGYYKKISNLIDVVLVMKYVLNRNSLGGPNILRFDRVGWMQAYARTSRPPSEPKETIDGSQFSNDTMEKAVLSRYLPIFLCNRVSLLKSLPLRIYATNLTFSALPLDTCLDWTRIRRLHCLLPWSEDATVDFMNTGGYNVSTQINQVLKETLIIWGEDDQIIDIKLAVVENLMVNRLCQSQVITAVNQAFLLFIGMECSKGNLRKKFAVFQRLTTLDEKKMFALAAAGSHKKEVGRLRS
ncbi:hypothetical protein Tco_0987470 [Tanacetum coccineum]